MLYNAYDNPSYDLTEYTMAQTILRPSRKKLSRHQTAKVDAWDMIKGIFKKEKKIDPLQWQKEIRNEWL